METLKNIKYADMRGFNYMPSNITFLRDVTDKFDEKIWNTELDYAKKLGANTLRVWFDIDSHMRDRENFLAVFKKIVELIGQRDMKMMPVLYNCWLDTEHPFGALYPQDIYSGKRERHYNYLKSVVGTFANEDTIIMWDMCNEPFSFLGSVARAELEIEFWQDLIAFFRKINPSQPLTMGTHSVVHLTPESIYEALDVLSCHPYEGWEKDAFVDTVLPHVEHANKMEKALVCTETFQGSLSDETRSLCVNRCKACFKELKVGYLAFQLMEGNMISARRDWTDENCMPGDRGFFPFVLKDGTVREGHSIL